VSQRTFASAFARALRRPAVVPLPASVVRRVFGQMGEEVLLQGQLVEPAVLKRTGFTWSAVRLEDAFAR
jgi:NAD dependent epimerase/dehydratase family enzyme